MPRSKFCRISEVRFPIPGDLIRSKNTGDFVNIVLDVYPERKDAGGYTYCAIRSVRFAETNEGDSLRLNGRRSRSFRFALPFSKDYFLKWEIVEEFVKADNSAERAAIVSSLKDVATHYQPEEE